MGEIAEMMLDGTLCEGCGVYLDGDGDGVPRRCEACRRDDSQPAHCARVACKTCKKVVKFAGLADHIRDAHGGPKKQPQQPARAAA